MKGISKGDDPSKIPAKYLKLNGLWGEWSGEELLQESESSPIRPKLDKAEQQLANELGISIYVFLAFSTELWDELNDSKLHLRKGHRLIRGGLQLATRSMPQGLPITIPMTNNIGFQNLAHVIVHMDRAEPDLGRKGFQPEHVRLAEKLAVSAVTAFRKRSNLLRKATGEPIFHEEIKLDQWIEQQKEHEKESPLAIKGKGLFLPTQELPIRSTPLTEQDVVATFNQMLSSGLVRGVHLISSSQYQQYDGLFRVAMDPPYAKYIHSPDNPLGVVEESFTGQSGPLRSPVKILEYKYNVDALIEDFQNEIKFPSEIGLVVAWEMGEKWRMMFDVTSYLDDQHTQLRKFHGCTHSFVHSTSGARAFEAIILKDMVAYLRDPKAEAKNQRKRFSEDSED
ncbi:hypothetical protein [Vitiosangium sp. GDMCC 1.1324]|uniref:hypothetical protein n=1 Tax=Vitiosangium sp. (strain GDMCC 1.1324) TaxID=2138576 RepID=UPI0011B3D934|nr:hypothetical protein [Vitiosangium sp. GDMCC 1.1324]